MLSVHFDIGQNLFREQIRDLAVLAVNHRGVRNGSLYQVLLLRRTIGAGAERYLRPAPQHLPHDPLMGLAGIFSDGVQTKYIPQALDDSGLTGAAPPDENGSDCG